MPVRVPLITDHASRILLEGLVDYAGLFPPAVLSMSAAVRQYAHYRASGAGWVLGRFVCPAADLAQFSEIAEPLLPRDAGAIPWRLSVIGSGDIAADLLAIAAFNERHRVCFEECGAIVDVLEVKAGSTDQIAAIRQQVPTTMTAYVEVPLDTSMDRLFAALAAHGLRAKIRTGGVTAAAFPLADAIVAFLRACLTHDVTAKATAGLHHPLRGSYRLTYDTDAATGRMYGFLNVFLAAALLLDGGTDAEALALLEVADAATLDWQELHVTWQSPARLVTLSRYTLQQVRERLMVSFGSCSFTEPVEELRAYGWL